MTENAETAQHDAAPITTGKADTLRLLLVQLLQVPALVVACLVPGAIGVVIASLWGSLVTAAGTDSHWRWRNHLLRAQCTAWLLFALLKLT